MENKKLCYSLPGRERLKGLLLLIKTIYSAGKCSGDCKCSKPQKKEKHIAEQFEFNLS